MYEHDMILIMLIVEYFVSDVMHACTHVLSTAGKRSVATATRCVFLLILSEIRIYQNWFYSDTFSLCTWTAVEAKEEDQVDNWIGGCFGACSVTHREHWMCHGYLDELANRGFLGIKSCRPRPLALIWSQTMLLFWYSVSWLLFDIIKLINFLLKTILIRKKIVFCWCPFQQVLNWTSIEQLLNDDHHGPWSATKPEQVLRMSWIQA